MDLDAKQIEALQLVKSAGDAGYRNWDGKRSPVNGNRLSALRRAGLLRGDVVAPGIYHHWLTDAGEAALAERP